MEHGRGMHVGSARSRHAAGRAAHRGADQIGVAEHHTLGEARRSAGVENACQIFIVPPHVFCGSGPSQQRFVMEHALGRLFLFPAIDHVAQGSGLLAQGLGHGAEVVVDHQHGRAGIVERVQNFRHRPARVARIEHAARPGHAHLVLKVAIGVERQHRNAVTLIHSQRVQSAGQTRHAIAQLPKGASAVSETRGHLIRPLLQGPMQRLGDVHACLRVTGFLREIHFVYALHGMNGSPAQQWHIASLCWQMTSTLLRRSRLAPSIYP